MKFQHQVLTFLWTTIFVYGCSALSERPTITPKESSITLEFNSNYTLSCSANAHIVWRSEKSHHFESYNTTTEDENRRYISTIYLQNVSAKHVGFYDCVFSNPHENIYKSIYVFVKDPNVLLAPTPSEDFAIFVDDNYHVLIPCKPTNPEIDVELFQPDGTKLRNIFHWFRTGVDYSPKKGFDLDFMYNYHSGLYICRPQKPSASNLAESISFYVHDNTFYVIVPSASARIISFSSGLAIRGETLILKCFVDVELSISSSYKINWKTPNDDSKNRSHETYENSTVMTPPGGLLLETIDNEVIKSLRFVAKNIIYVSNAQSSDEGDYKCEYRNADGNIIASDSFYVEYLEKRDETYLNISSSNATFFRKITKTAELNVYFRSFLPVEFRWIDPQGNLIDFSAYNGKFERFLTQTSTSLKILNALVGDTGQYICIAKNDASEKVLKIWVDIKDKPQIEVKGLSYYNNIQIGQHVNISVKVIANPPPLFDWTFRAIDDSWEDYYPGSQINVEKYNVTVKNNSFVETIFELVFIPQIWGEISLIISNELGNSHKRYNVIPGDIIGNISIIGIDPDQLITEGDEVTMTCAGTKYLFDKAEWRRVELTFELLTDEIEMFPTESNYSTRSTIVIKNITNRNAGIYECWGGKDGTYDYKQFINIVVNAPEYPKLVETNMGSLVERSVGQFLILICNATGKPIPFIKWYKDNKEINKSSDTDIAENGSILKIRHVNPSHGGLYMCKAESRLGSANVSSELRILDNTNAGISYPINTWTVIIGCIVIITVIALSVIFSFFRMKKNFQKSKNSAFDDFDMGAIEKFNPDLSLDEQADLLPYDKCFEFPRNRLQLGKRLGAGAFGIVLQGFAKGINPNEDETVVAVKMARQNAENEVIGALISELKIMVHLGQNLNVVNLLGAVTENKREIMLIVEYCRYGTIQKVLLHNRECFVDQINPHNDTIDASVKFNIQKCDNMAIMESNSEPTEHIILTTSDLVSWAFQVASGMDYLASRRVLHGDLAARNILLCEDNVVKICDFGLARSIYKNDIYKKQCDSPLPIKWLAVESIADNIFNVYTDVWSFGIAIWEIFSLATVPYPGMDANKILFENLKKGYRMDKPRYANQEIYDIMLECWSENPKQRPLFNELVTKFAKLLDDEVTHFYVNLNEPHLKWNEEYKMKQEIDYLIMSGSNELISSSPSPINANQINIPEKLQVEIHQDQAMTDTSI